MRHKKCADCKRVLTDVPSTLRGSWVHVECFKIKNRAYLAKRKLAREARAKR